MTIEKCSISLHGDQYVCLTAGDPRNPAMIMVHGWGHHPSVWTSTMERYQDRYYCVAVGVLGLGESDKPRHGDYSIQAHARDTLAIADALGIDRFILMGQSRGGQIALCLASQVAPERVIKLVDISGVVTGRLTPYMRWIMQPTMFMNDKLELWNTLGRFVFQHYLPSAILYTPYFADIWAVPKAVVIGDIMGGLRVDARWTTYRCMQTMMETNLVPDLHKITAPTLIIFGAQDGCVPPIEGVVAHDHIPHSQLVLIKSCGHYPMVEAPDAYFNALKPFLG